MEIDCRAVKQKLDAGEPFLLLDCRERDEFETVHLDGARLIPMSELQQRVDEIGSDRETEVVVYCHHGGRSLQVARWLTRQGFTDVKSMAGGIDQWAVEIDPRLPRY